MDEKIRKCCPNCNQFYHLKLQQSSTLKGNLPLFLACGHTICENCVSNLVKFSEPIECRICHQDMILEAGQGPLLKDKTKLYQFFPINVEMVGELTLQLLENAETKPALEDTDFFIDLYSIIKQGDISKATCVECHNATSKMCHQCSTILCETCFTKSHKNFVIFKNHVLMEIDEIVLPSTCKIHMDKPLDYYCNDCTKSVCMDCLVVGGEKSCKNHNVVSMQEVNENFVDELCAIEPKVDEIFRRLSKTAYDVGHLLYNMENETGAATDLNQTLATIEQHFSKLCSIVQKHKQEVVDIVTKLKDAEKSSLYTAKNCLQSALVNANKVMNSIRVLSNPKKNKQMNLAVLLEEAKQVLETPWYLSRGDVEKQPLKVAVNEDLCGLLTDYIHLEGNVCAGYTLCAAADLPEGVGLPPVPPAPVFAPVLPKDVRQSKDKNKQKATKSKEESAPPAPPTFYRNAPQYRTKSNSVTSLNSNGSDSSQRNYTHTNGQSRPDVQPKQKYSETHYPKQLKEDCQELVYVSHIVDPHNFYVQRTCHQSYVKDVLRQFRSAISLPRPFPNHVAPGKTYLAFNKADNNWQRCRVLAVDRRDPAQPLLQVFCYDFGSIETVSIDKLRLLSPAQAQTPPPLAIHCSLSNSAPNTGAWTSSDSLFIQKIIDNKQAVIRVRGVRATEGGDTLECDVVTYEDGVSLAHALAFHERARMPHPRLKYPPVNCIREKAKIYISNEDYKLRTLEEVCITHVVSPDKFYVRKKHQQSVYEQLSLELEQEYNLEVTTGSIYLPEAGMSCCVHVPEQERGAFSAAGSWARALVTGLPGRGRVALALVDSGAPLVAHWTALRYLHPKFCKLSALATECHLAGVTPLNKKWSPRAVALLQAIGAHWVELHVEARARGSLAVTLRYRAPGDDSPDPVCVNQEMVKFKFAITFGIYSFNKSDVTGDQVITNKSPLDEPVRHPKPKPEVQILKRSLPNEPQKLKSADLQAKDKGPLRLEAKVLQYQSPSQIYISLAHQQKTFNELFENIQQYYSDNRPIRRASWQVGDRCCAVCIQSQTWRRALILDIDEDNAKLFYSDFAIVETQPLANLAELAEEFASIGDAAIKCHLCRVIPAVGEEWPSITKEFLKELLDDYQRVFITKLGDFKNKSMPVEIWVYHTIQGGPLEPNKSEWRCLNDKIIEQGLGVPDRSQQAARTEVEAAESDEMLSFLNVTGSIHDWLQLEPMPTKPLPTFQVGSPAAAADECEDTAVAGSSNVMFISDWLPPEPLPSDEFVGIPTYIDNDGVIYLHAESQQGTLDLIRKALDVRFPNPDPKAKYQKWVVGEPCVALYFLDNRFYRGRVLDVNKETSSCLIHYIDYGNEEQCSFENLRKSIALHQIPTQAHRCVLSRVRPPGGHWPRDTLDYLHKSVVEKRCCVTVAGAPRDGITPVDLSYDKLRINDHLVEFELAEYNDGSKAVVRKFAPTQREQKQRPAAPLSDSEPDYIVESDSAASSSVVTARNWNEMLNEDEKESVRARFIAYPDRLDEQFHCNITVIHDTATLELDVIHEDNTALIYEELFHDLQVDGENRPAIDGIYENKACIALFQQDQQWYRASILQYSEAKAKVKVRYVDYGNIEVVDLVDVREIHPEWAQLMPSTVTVKLHGVKLNPDVDIEVITQEYMNIFLDKGPFIAKVIKNDNKYPAVQLHNEAGELIYQNLIEKEVFLKTE